MRWSFAVGSALAFAGALNAECAAAADRWLRAESANFVIYTDADREIAERYVARLETFDRVLRLAHRAKLDEPVRRKLPIYVLRRAGDMRRISPGVPGQVRGFYASSPEDTFAVAIAKAEAAGVLRPLAFDPHGGEAAAAARTLLSLLEAGQALPPGGVARAVAP